jgi:hypothetical protein
VGRHFLDDGSLETMKIERNDFLQRYDR